MFRHWPEASAAAIAEVVACLALDGALEVLVELSPVPPEGLTLLRRRLTAGCPERNSRRSRVSNSTNPLQEPVADAKPRANPRIRLTQFRGGLPCVAM